MLRANEPFCRRWERSPRADRAVRAGCSCASGSTPIAVSMSNRAGVRPSPLRPWRAIRMQEWKARLQPKKMAFMGGGPAEGRGTRVVLSWQRALRPAETVPDAYRDNLSKHAGRARLHTRPAGGGGFRVRRRGLIWCDREQANDLGFHDRAPQSSNPPRADAFLPPSGHGPRASPPPTFALSRATAKSSRATAVAPSEATAEPSRAKVATA